MTIDWYNVKILVGIWLFGFVGYHYYGWIGMFLGWCSVVVAELYLTSVLKKIK